ncbi:uncharacterized protein YjbK [Alkalibacillus flavidus]|uniref:Uncharacterized protein YjbK n=1 Tax=Alkalibacillus flavidus TaxID=546021 RepID=A0ABV2KXT1_9BACI
MQEIEIEFKNLLTEEEYKQLVADYMTNIEAAKQVNIYFETDDFQLKNAGAALRIREKANAYIATLKQPAENGLLETHDTLNDESFQSWCRNEISLGENIQRQLDALGIKASDLRHKGQLTTYRYECHDGDMIVVLDKSDYNGVSDYELEIEAPEVDRGKAYYHNVLAHYNIPERTTPNKIERFFRSVH